MNLISNIIKKQFYDQYNQLDYHKTVKTAIGAVVLTLTAISLSFFQKNLSRQISCGCIGFNIGLYCIKIRGHKPTWKQIRALAYMVLGFLICGHNVFNTDSIPIIGRHPLYRLLGIIIGFSTVLFGVSLYNNKSYSNTITSFFLKKRNGESNLLIATLNFTTYITFATAIILIHSKKTCPIIDQNNLKNTCINVLGITAIGTAIGSSLADDSPKDD
jgi:hypothetical protein